MRSRWEALRAGLVRSIRSLYAYREFADMKSRFRALDAFSDPGAVVSYLHGDDALDAKDALLGELVIAAQSAPYQQLATTLLLLGLWPGLDAVYNRRLKHFRTSPDELVSLLSEAFTALVARLDLRVVRRVAATLVMSTERDLMASRRRDWKEESKRAGDAELERLLAERLAHEGHLAEAAEATLGRPPACDLAECLSALRGRLEPIVGKDAELLIGVLVLEETQAEAGERLGLSHEAARKRFQRAMARIRHHLSIGCPTSGPEAAFATHRGFDAPGGVER